MTGEGVKPAVVAAKELATILGYSGPNSGFYAFLNELGVRSLPNRRGRYYWPHVEDKLKALHGMKETPERGSPTPTPAQSAYDRWKNSKNA